MSKRRMDYCRSDDFDVCKDKKILAAIHRAIPNIPPELEIDNEVARPMYKWIKVREQNLAEIAARKICVGSRVAAGKWVFRVESFSDSGRVYLKGRKNPFFPHALKVLNHSI